MAALGIGICAALLTSASFGAQAWKTWRTRDTGALATSAWIFTTLAFALWTTYGVLRGEWPIIVPNAFCFVLSGFILSLKLRRLEAPAPRHPARLVTPRWVAATMAHRGVRWRDTGGGPAGSLRTREPRGANACARSSGSWRRAARSSRDDRGHPRRHS